MLNRVILKISQKTLKITAFSRPRRVSLGLIFCAGFLFFGLAGQAWGATYYVNTSSGSNGNNGTSADTPWLDAQYASAMLNAGDTLNIIAQATNPVRYGLNPVNSGASGNVITIQGTNVSQKAFFTGTISVTHGDTIPDYLFNVNMEAWITSSNAWWWIEGGNTPTRESSIVQSGTYSAKFARVSASPTLSNSYIYLPPNTSMTVSFGHYETQNDFRFKFMIKDIGAALYLQNDKTWGASYNGYDTGAGANSNGAWATSTFTFTTNSAGRYWFQPTLPYTTTSYLDNVSLKLTNQSTYAWSAVDGHNYKLLTPKIMLTPNGVFGKSSISNWISSGVTALSWVTQASSLINCDATPNSWWYDSTNYDLYYNPAVGEDVTTLHIEIGRPREDGALAYYNTVNFGVQYLIGQFLSSYFSGDFNFNISAANNILNYCDGYHGKTSNFYVTAANATLNYCSGAYTYTEDNFDAEGAGAVVTLNKCRGDYAWDDGFQGANGGKIICNYCIAANPGRENQSDNNGFSSEGGAASLELYNVVAYGAYGPGIVRGGTEESIVRNSIAWGNVTGGGAGIRNVTGTGANLTADHNLYLDQYQWDTDPTDITLDPLWRNPANGDFHLQSGSPAIDSGTDVSLTTDYEGNPIYGAPDIGGYEYQPPYTMGTDGVSTSATIRTYGDEKFRNKTATSSATTADLSITIPNTDRTQWLDAEISTWDNTGVRHKVWTASSTVSGLTNTVYTVGDLEANKYYNVKLDNVLGQNITGTDCTAGICLSNSSGKITFTYTGTYSDHTFDVQEGDNTAPVRSSGSPSGTLAWNTTSATLSLTTDENATCKYGTTANTAYSSITNTFSTTGGTTSHSANLTNLSQGSNYTYYVRCQDTVGNVNSDDYLISFSMNAAPGGGFVYIPPIEKLKQKIAEISEKIAQLKVQLQQLLEKEVLEIPADYRFTVDLKYGQRNDDVKYLQMFLKSEEPEIYPEAIISGWFGPLTKKAVIKFQEKYSKDILAPWGLTKGTGFIGRTTRAKLNELMTK